MRCSHCGFDNMPGVRVCQLCGLRLAWVACRRCGSENPSGYSFCGQCGYPLSPGRIPEPVIQATPEMEPLFRARPKPQPHKTPSPIALIGFGAILALASAAFPWYLLLSSSASVEPGEQTIFNLLQLGWQWFPGLPLIIIAISAVLSALVGIAGGESRARPIISTALGLVILFSATWLWRGYTSRHPAEASGSLSPATGAAFVVVGAIILVTVGLWTAHTLSSKGIPPGEQRR